MATHTVNGCLLGDGTLAFDDTAVGCTGAMITGCLVKSGEHEGKIEITHDYGGCSTQYYACLDKATGKFKFEADDGCCEECEYTNYCPSCYGVDQTPKYIIATFTGVDSCGSGCDWLDGVFILESVDPAYPPLDCLYVWYGEDGKTIWVSLAVDLIGPDARLWFAGKVVDEAIEETCFETGYIFSVCDESGTDLNVLVLGDCGGGNTGYDGSVEWETSCYAL